ncbi:MAG: hypothetical protein Q7K65_05135 [Candidatus Buchananbacteria bacterium]|nr:hypothetical protein [Candidatus Buchananbacteria bacterium]
MNQELVQKLIVFLREFDKKSTEEQAQITINDTFDAIGFPTNLRSDFIFHALLANAKRIMGEDTSKLDQEQEQRMSLLKHVTTRIAVASSFMKQRISTA